MSKFKDLTGQRFGKLIVLEKAQGYTDSNGRKRSQWKCLCDCGNTVVVTGANLLAGKTKSCGCLRKGRHNRNPSPKLQDLTGQKFGRLTVIKKVESLKWATRWECLCDCGNTTIVKASHLKSGAIKSCGCLREESKLNRCLQDLTGQRFGKLVVLERAEDYIDPNGQRRTRWKCLCDCGNLTIVRTSHLKSGLSKSCGCVKSVGEQKVSQILQNKNIAYVREFFFKDLRGSRGGVLKFDFCIHNKEENNICLIEYQGIQHYVEYIGDKDFGKYERDETDQLKRDYCAAHNIPFYEIAYNEDEEQRVEEILKDLQETHHINLSTITKDNTVPNESKDLEV